MHARKSLLFSDEEEWIRKRNNGRTDLFDVTMGSYDGAEVCELVGLYLLSQIESKFEDANIGLYRDDGLAIFSNLTPSNAERVKKALVKIFKENGLDITVDANLKIVNFLDVTLNLVNKTFYPYCKPNNTPLYINKQSNHPHQIIKNLPEMINRRICEISCNEEEYKKAKPTYKNALEKSGFNEEMSFKKYEKVKRKRKRNVMYFNPPFSKSVKTNVGNEFLKLVSKHFPVSHKYRSLFNKNNLKISYSCMTNVGNIIKAHNAKVLSSPEDNSRECNCRKKAECPLNGKCLTKCVVYKAVISSDEGKKVYYGSSMGPFKERYRNHKKSFENRSYREETKLSKLVWDLKDKNRQFEIAWTIEKECIPYKASSRKCDLCLTEKLCIVRGKADEMINKRSEIANKCRHTNKFTYARILSNKI